MMHRMNVSFYFVLATRIMGIAGAEVEEKDIIIIIIIIIGLCAFMVHKHC